MTERLSASEFLTDATYRSKNRVHVKRLYYKKLSVLEQLRQQVDELTAEHTQLLDIHHQQDAQPSKERKEAGDLANLHSTYVHLSLLKRAMAEENEELKRLQTITTSFYQQIVKLAAVQAKDVAKTQEEQEYRRQNPEVKVNPLTLEQCCVIAHAAYQEIKVFRANCSSAGTSVFGWRDRHSFQRNKLRFSLEKVYDGDKMEKIAEKTWNIFSSAQAIKRMYSRHSRVDFHEVQRLDENAVVYYYTLEREDSDVRMRAFMLSMRVNLGEEGWMVFFRTLNPKTYFRSEEEPVRRGRKKLEPRKEDVWVEGFTWSLDENVGDEKSVCRHIFGGELECTALMTASWWHIQVLQMALRMESEVVETKGLLPL